MMNNNIFKQSFILLKDNLMVMQPLFIGVLLMMLVIMPISNKTSFDLGCLFSIIIAVLCFTTFLAGWFSCVKSTVALKNEKYETPEQRSKANINILKSFLPGVGEYMLPTTVVTILYALLAYGTFKLYKIFAIQMYISNNLPKNLFKIINTSSQAEIAKYIQTNFSVEQLQSLLLIFACGFIIYFIFNILVLWFAPAVFYTTKNPIFAMFKAIEFTFKNLFISFLIVLVMFCLNLLMSFFNGFLNNQYLAFIPMLLSFFYCIYYVLTVFLYYESKTQDNCNNRSECNG